MKTDYNITEKITVSETKIKKRTLSIKFVSFNRRFLKYEKQTLIRTKKKKLPREKSNMNW